MRRSVRNTVLSALLLGGFVAGAIALSSAAWSAVLAVVLGLAGVALLTGDRWRTGALLASALAAAVSLLNVLADLLSPAGDGSAVVRTSTPAQWVAPEPVLGLRLLPGLTIVETATYDGRTLYRATYTTTGEGTRTTPPAPAGAPTYLFMGASVMFGQGLSDDETLPARFAALTGGRVRTVNFSAPGYAVNNLVRAFEVGRLDGYRGVAAVVTWITPSLLEWGAGDAEWLAESPRYVLGGGEPGHTGTFREHRFADPLAGLAYLARKHLPFVRRIGERQRQEAQADLFVAMVVRLQALARERLGAPLIVVHSWFDGDDRLAAVLDRLRAQDVPLLSVAEQTHGRPFGELQFPHDGHPTALTDELIAIELKRRLVGP